MRAFEALVPSRWIVRPEAKDYGIDRSVEIVDPNDTVTGKRFFVQLKATDEADTARGLRVRLRHATYEYYRSLDLPVLIVRYHAPSGAVYSRWAHDIDRHGAKKDSKSFTIVFTQDDRWSDARAAGLAEDLDDWRWITAPSLAGPLILRLELESPQLYGRRADEIARAIEQLAAPHRRWLVLSELPAERPRGRVILGVSGCEVRLAGGFACMLHAPPKGPKSLDLDEVAADVLLAVAFALLHAQHRGLACALARSALNKATFLRDPSCAANTAALLVSEGFALEVVQLAVRWACERVPVSRTEKLLVPLLIDAATVVGQQIDQVMAALQDWIDATARYTPKRDLATCYYNVGRLIGFRFMRHGLRSRAKDAVDYLHRALHADGRYGERAYFWEEMGGILFEAGHASWAAGSYARALSLGGEPVIRAKRGDALLWAGRFDEGIAELTTYRQSAAEPDVRWALLAHVAPEIVVEVGGGPQRREAAKANARFGELQRAPLPADPGALRETLALDALCADAWYELGVLAATAGDKGSAVRRFALSAILRRDNVKRWTVALIEAIWDQPRNPNLLVMIAVAGFRSHGVELYRAFAEAVATLYPSDVAEQLVHGLRELLSTLGPNKVPAEVRLIDPETGTVRKVSLGDRVE